MRSDPPAPHLAPVTPRVLIVHSWVDAASAPPDELDTLVQVAQIAGSLGSLGCAVRTAPCRSDPARPLGPEQEELLAFAELIWPVIESLEGRADLGPIAQGWVDSLGTPMVGAGVGAVVDTMDKLTMKRILRASAIPTPRWYTEAELRGGAARLPPVIIKAVSLCGSIGLHDGSVLRDASPAEVLSAIEQAGALHGTPFFAEAYVPEREIKVSLLAAGGEVEVLPLLELDYSRLAADAPRILTYDAVWGLSPPELDIPFMRVAGEPALERRIADLATATWRAFGLAGWARLDMRVDAHGEAFVTDVNPNCSLESETSFCVAARLAGLEHPAMVARILATSPARPQGPIAAFDSAFASSARSNSSSATSAPRIR